MLRARAGGVCGGCDAARRDYHEEVQAAARERCHAIQVCTTRRSIAVKCSFMTSLLAHSSTQLVEMVKSIYQHPICSSD